MTTIIEGTRERKKDYCVILRYSSYPRISIVLFEGGHEVFVLNTPTIPSSRETTKKLKVKKQHNRHTKNGEKREPHKMLN